MFANKKQINTSYVQTPPHHHPHAPSLPQLFVSMCGSVKAFPALDVLFCSRELFNVAQKGGVFNVMVKCRRTFEERHPSTTVVGLDSSELLPLPFHCCSVTIATKAAAKYKLKSPINFPKLFYKWVRIGYSREI